LQRRVQTGSESHNNRVSAAGRIRFTDEDVAVRENQIIKAAVGNIRVGVAVTVGSGGVGYGIDDRQTRVAIIVLKSPDQAGGWVDVQSIDVALDGPGIKDYARR